MLNFTYIRWEHINSTDYYFGYFFNTLEYPRVRVVLGILGYAMGRAAMLTAFGLAAVAGHSAIAQRLR